MSEMHDILKRLQMVESLDKNQKKVNQLGAEFKPKTSAVLTAKTDPKNPMGGKLVGGCEESVEKDEAVAEDILAQVKKGLDDYLKGLSDKPSDSHIFDRPSDRDLAKRVKIDRDLIPQKDSPKKEIKFGPVKTIKIDDVNECGIYGDEDLGFEIRRGDKVLPTKFKAIDHAIAAADAYAAMRRSQNSNPDYREEK